MTIEQERDIAVRALEELHGFTECEWSRNLAKQALDAIKRKQALQALVDQAQDLDMGYGSAQIAAQESEAAMMDMVMHGTGVLLGGKHVPYADLFEQASPVAQDERTELAMFQYWASCQTETLTPIAAWKAGRASVSVPAAQPVGEAVAQVLRDGIGKWYVQPLINWDDIGEGTLLFRSQPKCETCKGELGHEKALGSSHYEWIPCPDCAPPVAQDQDAAKLQRLRDGLAKWGWFAEFGALAAEVLAEVKS